MHAITLCCAHSVESMVDEVARNLRGLGFRTTVVCGGQARDALMGRQRDHDEPTIYVVCVQGALRDTVLKPLRTALATHGGPNEHLFVAVLDLSLPLAMVGQIRRFAEAIERLPGAKRPTRRDGLGERRQWREHIGATQMNDVQTRAYRSLKVVEPDRPDPRDPVAARAKRPPEPSGPRPIVSQRKPAKISATRKYRAVTGPEPIVPAVKGPPKGKRRGRTVLYGDQTSVRRHRIQVPGVETKTVAEPAKARRPPPMIGSAIAEAAPRRRGRPVLLALGVLLLAGVGTAFATGKAQQVIAAVRGGDWLAQADGQDVAQGAASPDGEEDGVEAVPAEGEDALGAEEHEPAADDPEDAAPPEDNAAAEADPAEADPAEAEDPEATDAEGDDHDEPGAEPDPAANDAAGAPPSGEGALADGEADPAEADPVDETPTVQDAAGGSDEDGAEPARDDAQPDDEPGPGDGEAADEAAAPDDDKRVMGDDEVQEALRGPIASGRVRVTERMFVARKVGEPTNWAAARRRCLALELGGVAGWRLPHPRELRLMGAIGMLHGEYWSTRTDKYDREYAMVYESGSRRFATWAKAEFGGKYVCVRRRKKS